MYKGCLKLVHKLLRNQQTVQYADLILPLRSWFFLFLKWMQISGLTLWTLFHLYVSDPETIAIFLASLDLKIVNLFCQNMVCAPSIHKNPEFLQLESFSLILPKVPLMFALSSVFCRFWFYIVTYTLFSSFRLNRPYQDIILHLYNFLWPSVTSFQSRMFSIPPTYRRLVPISEGTNTSTKRVKNAVLQIFL